jgi:hypothetical protein
VPTYIALTYTPDVDWTNPPPEYAGEMKEYRAFGEAAASEPQARHLAPPDR